MESFYRKNDIGVSIEYTIVGYYDEDATKYVIFTDFVEDEDSPTAIRLYVGTNVNGQIVDVDESKRNEIISNLFQLIAEKTNGVE